MNFASSIHSQEDKERIINDFFNKMDSNKYIQYNCKWGFTDASKGDYQYEAVCSFKQVPGDTLMGAYYFVKSENEYRVWNGKEFLQYNSEYFKNNDALCQSINKHPEKFSEQVHEMDGKKFYSIAAVKNSFFLFNSPVELKKLLTEITRHIKEMGTLYLTK